MSISDKAQSTEKQKRLAQALRANLKRRKQQVRPQADPQPRSSKDDKD